MSKPPITDIYKIHAVCPSTGARQIVLFPDDNDETECIVEAAQWALAMKAQNPSLSYQVSEFQR